jgi:ribosome-associated translation inhibitor RaiA
MEVCIQAQGIHITDEIKRQMFEKLALALDRLEKDILDVSVCLEDINGPLLGGEDKACRIVVRLRKQDSLVVEDIDESVEMVIDRVTDRLGVIACQRFDSLRRANRAIQRKRLL